MSENTLFIVGYIIPMIFVLISANYITFYLKEKMTIGTYLCYACIAFFPLFNIPAMLLFLAYLLSKSKLLDGIIKFLGKDIN